MPFSQVATKKVVFPRGNSGTTINGVCKGDKAIEYISSFGPNQALSVDMKTIVSGCYFNLIGSTAEFLSAGERED